MFILLLIIFTLIFNYSCADEKYIKTDFDDRIKNFILKNPEIIIESLKIYEEKKVKADEEKKNKFISENSTEIYKSNGFLFDGNKDSNLVIVEYFDYNCGYCKKFHEEIQFILNDNKNIKVVYKNLPVLSEDSKKLAKISIAIGLENNKKFLEFHEFVMKSKKRIKESDLKFKIQDMDLNYSEILTLSESKEVEKIIEKNFVQANNLGIRGTPALIVKNELIEGYVSKKVLSSLLQAQQ